MWSDDGRRAPPVAGTDAMDAEFKKIIGCDALRIEIPEVLVATMVAEASGGIVKLFGNGCGAVDVRGLGGER